MRNADFELLKEMANEVGITTEIIKENNYNTGGAQYLLRNVNSVFWEKVERNCVNLYKIIDAYNKKNDPVFLPIYGEYNNIERSERISPWCSDMWAVLWNLWYYNIPVSVNPNLDFVWPDTPIKEWGKIKILHYTFVGKNSFKKQLYKIFPPWYDKTIDVDKIEKCEDILYQHIKNTRLQLEENRTDLKTCFVFNIANISKCNVIEQLFYKHFKCEVRFLCLDEANTLPLNMNAQLLNSMPDVEYFVIHSGLTIIDLDRYETLIRSLKKNFLYYKLNIRLRKVYEVDRLHFNVFSQLLDTYYLKVNVGRLRLLKQGNDIQIVKKEYLDPTNSLLLNAKSQFVGIKSLSINKGYLIGNLNEKLRS
ncbi:hypothetical protein [Sphingobacterium thalpophilum]|uniref:hypothetical protein n=1 Tax=Sphingobacterium thalpophilum TaxID=259 RepID=UPI003C7666B2